jgi:hypothetical protein
VSEGLEKVVQELEERSIRAPRLEWVQNFASSPDIAPGVVQHMNCDRTISRMRDLPPKIISGDSR